MGNRLTAFFPACFSGVGFKMCPKIDTSLFRRLIPLLLSVSSAEWFKLLECEGSGCVRLLRLGHKIYYISLFFSLSLFVPEKKPAAIRWGHSSNLWRGSHSKELRLPSSSYMSELPWKQILEPQSSCWITAALANIWMATSWETLSQNHSAKPFPDF